MDPGLGWSTNESLLQSYRSTFISAQSFLIAGAAFSMEENEFVTYAIAVVAVVMIFFAWLPVVIARHRLVDFYKYQLDLPTGIDLPQCDASDYVHDKKARNAFNRACGLRTNWRDTRRILDGVVPALFVLLWITIAIIPLFA